MSKLCGRNKFYYSVRSRLGVIKTDLREKWPISLKNRLWLWKMGFLSDKYVAYNLLVNNPKDYSTDYQEIMARFINQPYSEILNNKLIFEMVYSKYVQVPKTLALINDGNLIEYPLLESKTFIHHSQVYKTVDQLLTRQGKLVIKPVRGAMGTGVMIVEKSKSGHLIINGQQRSKSELDIYFQKLKDYFVSEYIDQADYSKHIYPHANNTMRLLTMICPENKEPFIAAAVKRIGTDQSAPVDNNSIGGMAASIDIEEGILTAASRFMGSHVAWFDRHPDSGALIKGVMVPNWSMIKRKILQVAGSLPFIKYVGWDVIDQDEGIVILEGNNHPQSRLLQMHKPMLKDERVRKFYHFHKLLGK